MVAILIRKLYDDQIRIPVIQMESSQKSAKAVDILDLAAYMVAQHAIAHAGLKKLNRLF